MKLIDPNEIRFVLTPIAPVLSGGLVHYERVAFQQEVSQIRRIEAEPSRTGSWIISSKEQTGCLIPVECRCSRCGQQIDPDSIRLFRYCPNCGADMRGEQDDESRSNSNAQTDTRARGMGATDKSSGI